MEIKRIYLMFKSHFDIGFTMLAEDIVRYYAGDMLDRVFATCDATKDMGNLRYVWTMPAWPLQKIRQMVTGERKEKLDAIHICLPSYLHAEYAVRAMEKGIPVLLEKPACLQSGSFIDVAILIQSLYDNPQLLSLEKEADLMRVGTQKGRFHNAVTDTDVTADLFIRLFPLFILYYESLRSLAGSGLIPFLARENVQEYYDSELWLQDFEADEAGKLPKDLKRGVLSEDAVYDLITDHEHLLERMEKATLYESTGEETV